MTRTVHLAWLVIVGCSSTPTASDGGSVDDGSLDQVTCDPRPVYDAAPTESGMMTDSGVIDLDSGGSGPPGTRWACYVDLGGDELYNNCTPLGQTCCDLKDLCYTPSTEPDFCLHPYCN